MLEGLLPAILPANFIPHYLVFEGKQDLEKNLVKKLRGWLTPDSVFVVLRDQDSGDCYQIKRKLRDLCQKAGKKDVLIRIACRELESYYLGDLAAVEKGLGLTGIAAQQSKRKFKDPDALGSPSEELFNMTNHVYQKVRGSRAIAPYLRLDGNTSRSFNTLIHGIRATCGISEEEM